MSRRCDLTGKRRLVGNKVSHSNIKTKMQQEVNLKTKRVFDPVSGETVKLRLSTSAIRTLEAWFSFKIYSKIRREIRSS